MNRQRLRGPLLVLAAAAAMLGTSFVVVRWHDWTPLRLPVDLTPGVVKSQPFRVDVASEYLVSVEVDRPDPRDDLHCLLDLPVPVLRWLGASAGERSTATAAYATLHPPDASAARSSTGPSEARRG